MHAIVIDSTGYLWLATNAGLSRYDGHTFKVYRHNPSDTNSIADNRVTSLHVDAQNRIWMGTEANGVDCFDRTTEKFTHYTTANGLGSNFVSGFLRTDYYGNLIVLHYEQDIPADIIMPKAGNRQTGATAFEVKKLTEVYPGIAKTTGSKPIPFFCFTATGDMWYYTYDSIYHLTAEALKTGGPYEVFEKPRYRTGAAYVLEFFLDKSKRNLYLPDSNRMSVYNEAEKKFVPCMQLPPGYSYFGRPFMDNDGRVWCALENGKLIRTNAAFNIAEVIELTTPAEIKGGLPSMRFWLQDKFGNIWIGTNGFGFIKINTRRDLFKHIPENGVDYDKLKLWQQRVIKPGEKAVYDPSFPRRWATVLSKINLDKDKFELPGGPFNIACDSNGCFWVHCPKNNDASVFLVKINPANNTRQTMAERHGDISKKHFLPLIVDRDNDLWYSERSMTNTVKLFHFTQSTGKEDTFVFPVKNVPREREFVRDWYEDTDDRLWLATQQGLFCFNKRTYTWQTFQPVPGSKDAIASESLLNICADPAMPGRYLWIGTAGAGLCKMDKATGKFTTYTTAHGLPDDIVYTIQSDKHNNLWIGTGNGLCWFKPATLQAISYSRADGIPGSDFNTGEYSKAANGELYFGFVDSYIYFNPEDFYKLTPPAQMAITRLKLLNKPVNYPPDANDANAFSLAKPIEHAQELVFNYDQRMISFTFSLLDFTNPVANKYKYILEGLNDNWIDNGNGNEAVFTNLSPGNYTFKVLGQSSTGTWAVNAATVNITILPPWWATWWFRSIIVLTVAGMLYALYRYRLQQALRLEQIRNQIAQDLHDEIGSTLSSISLYSAVMRNSLDAPPENTRSILNKIIQSTTQMLESMNDIVWTIKADNDSFEQVVNRMRAFAVNMTETRNIHLYFKADRHAEQLKLDMNQRKNIYLIYKEAVNNAVKYSACKTLRINVADGGGKLHIAIEDDGSGFDFEGALGNTRLLGGNGLRGIKARAKEINATLNIVSTPEKGTCVELMVEV